MHGQHIEGALRAGVGEPESEQLFEIGQAVRPAEIRLIAVEHQPGHQREGLGDDREVDPFDAASKRQKPKDQCEERRHQDGAEDGGRETVERLPKQRQFLDLVPHHEVRQVTAVHALFSDRQHHDACPCSRRQDRKIPPAQD